MNPILKKLRDQAIAASLFRPGTLQQAIERLGFVQADPIRSPARAQDLILRHRVKDYRVGDIDEKYHLLGLEEDRLYAHGFMPQSTCILLHPRVQKRLSSAEKRVLDIAVSQQRIHPRDLETYLGGEVRNVWGGQSKMTTLMLQSLHHRGFLRIAGRDNGIRVYEPSTQTHNQLDSDERLRQLVLLIASILGPLSDKSLRTTIGYLAHGARWLKEARSLVPRLIESGDLDNVLVDGVRYVWPAGRVVRSRPNQRVYFLSPFDPLVWDRQRFEHFWGWQYRFEAYTPPSKRKLGYYAMPMLWQDAMIGWVNVSNRAGTLDFETGFIKVKPKDPAFGPAFDAEINRFEIFLQKREY